MRNFLVSLFGKTLFFVLALSTAYGASITYTYDPLNRLIGVVYDDGTTVEYGYDDAGNRVVRNVSSPSGIDADFTAAPTTGVAPLTVAFTDQSAGAITGRSWDFGDGENSTSQSPEHTYANPGTYSVILTVSSGTATSSRSATISVAPAKPVADFSATPTEGILPLTVSFTDSSTGDVSDWLWSFGDGDISTSQNPTHTYWDAGTYETSLTVTGPRGASDPVFSSIIVNPIPTTPGMDQFTKLLLHGEGLDGNSTIVDSSVYGHVPSSVTGVVTSSAQKAAGISSLAFDGSGHVVYANSEDWCLAGGRDFTIDAWVYYTGGNLNGICGTLIPGDNSQWGFSIANGYLSFYTKLRSS